MGYEIFIRILSGSNIGGRYPFIVACFDNDLSTEVYKTQSSHGGAQVMWNEAFSLDLKSQFKTLSAAGKKEPAYMTFFLFDRGVQGNPSLGSAGVRLSLLRETGKIAGDFPIINGQGSLNLAVEGEKSRFDWFPTSLTTAMPSGIGSSISSGLSSDKAKFAAGAVGIGTVAAVTAVAISKHMKKKEEKEGSVPERDRLNPDGTQRKKKSMLSKIPGIRALTGDDHSSSSEGEGHGDHSDERYVSRPDPRYGSDMVVQRGSRESRPRAIEHRDVAPRDARQPNPSAYDAAHRVDYMPASSAAFQAQPPQLGSHERPWWDVDSEEDNGVEGFTRPTQPTRPVKPILQQGRRPYDGDNFDDGNYDNRPDEGAASVHIHYHDNGNNGRSDSFDKGTRDDDDNGETVYQHRVRVQEPNRTSEYVEERHVTEIPEDLNRNARNARAIQNNPYVWHIYVYEKERIRVCACVFEWVQASFVRQFDIRVHASLLIVVPCYVAYIHTYLPTYHCLASIFSFLLLLHWVDPSLTQLANHRSARRFYLLDYLMTMEMEMNISTKLRPV